MKITNEFTVHTPIERAWELLTDLEAIAPCMPGAQLTGVDGDTYKGKVKVKVGPVISEFAGTARFVEKSDTDYRAAIDAKGRDARSAGNAAAMVTAVLRPDGDRTTVSVDTDLKISGKLAQFGSGMIKEVSGKLLAQFVTNLEAKLAADSAPAPTGPDSAPAEPDAAVSTDSGAATPAPAPAPVPASAPASESASAVADPVAASVAAVETVPETAVSPAPVSPAPINGVSLTDSANREASPPALRAPARELDTAEAEPLDLLSVAGSSVYKRLVPLAIGAVVVLGVLAWLIVRRR
jgi:carbon monoxide dehydrogenase subunit G